MTKHLKNSTVTSSFCVCVLRHGNSITIHGDFPPNTLVHNLCVCDTVIVAFNSGFVLLKYTCETQTLIQT